jgi:hypothetical protein|tara:strand:+ start:102 stop:737 length:636 start_codon:yes stop_codon:yes gene_type:complete
METVTELLHEEALFIPSENGTADGSTYTPKVEGDYLGHITDTRTLVREFKTKEGRNVKARIFNYKVHVAQENSAREYTYTDRNGTEHKTSGEPYVGWTVNGRGIFRFLEPKDGDTFESNSENNVAYLRFCQALGLTIETTKRDVNGRTVDVQILPTLTEDDINGRPVIAVVGRDKDWINSDGESMPSWKIKYVKLWKDGKRLASTAHDLPF